MCKTCRAGCDEISSQQAYMSKQHQQHAWQCHSDHKQTCPAQPCFWQRMHHEFWDPKRWPSSVGSILMVHCAAALRISFTSNQIVRKRCCRSVPRWPSLWGICPPNQPRGFSMRARLSLSICPSLSPPVSFP